MTDNPKVFVHLSDIHFSGFSGDATDRDFDLRVEVENDLRYLRQTFGLEFDAMAVTGDIAYSGSKDEYRKAEDWLASVAELLGFDEANIWVVPGNHDVDRRVTESSSTLTELIKQVDETPPKDVGDLIVGWDRDAALRDALYLPLENYNQFVEPFRCALSADRPFWDSEEPLRLTEEIDLRLRGLNSVLVSSRNDREWKCEEPANLILGTHQMPEYVEGTVCMTLCHHPPNWLRDRKFLEPYLNTRATIQLYGHVHNHQVEVGDSSIRLVAGAVHPERDDQRLAPGYNVFSCSVLELDDEKFLSVDIYPRIWSFEKSPFVPNTQDSEAGHRTEHVRIGRDQQQKPSEAEKIEAQIAAPEVSYMMSDAGSQKWRSTLFQFLKLPYYDRLRIARSMELLSDDDEHLSDRKKFENVVRRLKDRDLLDDLVRSLESKSSTDDDKMGGA